MAAAQPSARAQQLYRRLQQPHLADTSRVNTLNDLSWELLNSGQSDSAWALAQRATLLARQSRYPTGLSLAYRSACEFLMRKGELQEASRYARLQLTEAQKTNQNPLLLRAYRSLTLTGNMLGNFDQVRRYARQGLQLSQLLALPRWQIDFAGDLADAFTRQGKYPQALVYYLRASSLEEQYKLNDLKPYTAASIGNIYLFEKDYPRAIEYTRKSAELFRQAGNLAYVALCYNNLGDAYAGQKNLQAAQQAYLQAQQIFREQQSPFEAVSASALGQISYELGRHEEALAYHQKALAGLRQLGEQNLLITGLNRAAQTYAALHNNAQAELLARESLQLAHKLGIRADELVAADLLAHLAKERGNFQQALGFAEQAATLRDSVFSHEKSEAIGRLQGAFDLSRERQRVQLLRKNQQLQQQRLHQQRLLLGALALGFVVVLGAGLMLWRINKILSRKNREIEEQRTALAQLNATKDRLFSIIGHDLRGPLNSLHAFVSLLNIRQLPQEKLIQYAQRLNQTLDQTLALIDNLLSWAAVQMQASERVNPEAVRLQEAVEENFRLLRTAAEQKNIALLHTLEATEWAWADPDMVRLVLRNLLSNAIKFTSAGGQVQVSSTQEGGSWQLAVADTGVGLSAEALQALLSPAEPARSTAGTAQESGTGLGLVLCRDFVARNGGRLWAESAGPGRGTTFYCTFPQAAALSIVA
ncbi:tetratricopeptide repeat-containing sensor histidine kinase [Hymenobacter sp. DG25B]|uniref:tetratricopeptide repeat-containing sensor histidine kinase n=1 Tax=Hymenobacter sp. DG25B TaxID=1385664 RepID=UPI0018CC97A1|nr:tetratricopeptide repeat-containing sensor histidine kinase [Hymenobacter sp. DG25B]